ncbi:hypothetical protein ACIRSU_00310 [Streptomyces sp. NPDC101160]|uniref:hypothetical protein n=1 Tax=Streptomyces sp. NPDC101160 TaxID=3366118 RepID=UPI00380FB7C4
MKIVFSTGPATWPLARLVLAVAAVYLLARLAFDTLDLPLPSTIALRAIIARPKSARSPPAGA